MDEMTEDEFKRLILDDAVAVEALRICEERPGGLKFREVAQTAARLAREGYTPPPPVDPDILAYRQWTASSVVSHVVRRQVLAGAWDNFSAAEAFVAGSRMAREQEQERAKMLVEYAEGDANRGDGAGMRANAALAAYKAGKVGG
jgi:hypothetical protein